jgi:hypothetical protein
MDVDGRAMGRVGQDPFRDNRQDGSEEAKTKGVWVQELNIEPKEFTCDGKAITLKEAWLERRVKSTYVAVWLPALTPLEGYCVCFTVGKGEETLCHVPSDAEYLQGKTVSFFAIDGQRHSVSAVVRGGERRVFYERVSKRDFDALQIRLVSSSKEVGKAGKPTFVISPLPR